jgi:hypothetical protein
VPKCVPGVQRQFACPAGVNGGDCLSVVPVQ